MRRFAFLTSVASVASVASAVVFFALGTTSPAQQPASIKAAKSDVELIQGAWVIVGLETGGKAESDKNYRGNTFTFSKDKVVLKEGNFPSIEFSLTLDATKSPKTIDLASKYVTLRGIYKLESDDLTLSLGIGAGRPTEFATKTGGETETFTLKRSKWEKYTHPATGFTVEMPGKPEEITREPDTVGESATTLFVVRSEMERLTYSVSMTSHSSKLTAKQAEMAFEAAVKVALTAVSPDAKATETERTTPKGAGGSPAKEFAFTLEFPDVKEKGSARARAFVNGDRLFVLTVIGSEESTKSPSVSRFWGSFRATATKPK